MSFSPPLALVLVEPDRQQRRGRRKVGQADQGRNVGVEGVESGLLRPPGGRFRLSPLSLNAVKLRG
jgi:hypothetical protein